MKRKSNSIIYLIIICIVTFCLITINLFIYLQDINKLYEDNHILVDNTHINYPYFADEKDLYITEFLDLIDTTKVDYIKYLVNYLGDYTNIIFRLYQNDVIVDYYSITVNKTNKISEITDIITNEEKFLNKIKLFIDNNKLNLTFEEYQFAKKSYLFKDNEVEIYVSNYNEEKTISLITINYWELKDDLKIPFRLDKRYDFMSPEFTEDEHVIPIITDEDISNKKLVAFTFDDGPTSYTLELLDTLDQFNANATFFLVGYNVKIRNSIVLEIYNRGFELGNHTTDHSRLTRFNCEKANEKINQNQELVKNITNDTMKLFRPPYGAINDKLQECIDYPIILWSVDSRDWETRNTESIVTEVLANIKENDIVLFHDLYQTTIDAVKILLPILYADDYKVVSVSELFEAKSIDLENNQIYRKAS